MSEDHPNEDDVQALFESAMATDAAAALRVKVRRLMCVGLIAPDMVLDPSADLIAIGDDLLQGEHGDSAAPMADAQWAELSESTQEQISELVETHIAQVVHDAARCAIGAAFQLAVDLESIDPVGVVLFAAAVPSSAWPAPRLIDDP